MIPPGYASVRKVYSQLKESLGSEAYGKLEFLLSTGKLVAYSMDDSEVSYSKLTPGFWKGMTRTTRLEIFQMGIEEAQAKGLSLNEIFVREVDLAKILGPKTQAPTAGLDDKKSVTPTRAGGRPVDYDWDAIWAGIVWLVNTKGLPKRQEVMIERVQRWYEKTIKKDNAPSRTALQPRIKKLFAQMAKLESPDEFDARPKRKSTDH